MKFSSLDDFYKSVGELTAALEAQGFKGEAQGIRVLMHEVAWTTGSELLGELDLQFSRMKGRYPEHIAVWIQACHDFAKNHRRILGLDP